MLKNRLNSLAAGALVLLCLIVFGNTLSHEFVYDDMKIILANPHIGDFGSSWPHFFDRTYFVISGGEASYRPLTTLSYFLLHQLFGLKPWGYHLGSLLLHAGNAVLVFMLLGRLQPRRRTAFLAACLFAVHPVVTEAVNCVSFNEDLLATLFFLLSLLTAVRSGRQAGSGNHGLQWLSWAFFACALLSKEMALTLPLTVLLQAVLFSAAGGGGGFFARLFEELRRRRLLFGGYLVVIIGYLYLRFVWMTSPAGPATHGVPLLTRIAFVPFQILNFVKLALFPFGLSAEYVHAYPPHFWSAANLAGLALVALLIACAWRLRIKYPVITFGLAWFLVTLAPVLNLYELINPLAERYLYLPLVGVAIAAAAALEAVLFREGRARLPWVRQIAAGVVVCLLLGLSAYSFERNRVWQDNYTLFSQTAKRVPESARVHGGLGLAFQQMGRLSEAAREFRRAIALNPRLAHAHFSLANVLEQSGRIDEAIAAYERAAALEPGYGNVYYNLGGLYVKKGLLQQALTAYLRHLELNPRDIEARNNLGVVYAMQGRLAAAEAQWRQVLAIEPDNREALANLEKAKTVGAGGSD